MIIRFLKTPIGMALVAALIIVGVSAAFKIKGSGAPNDIAERVGLIADASVQDALRESDPSLDAITGTTTTDDIIRPLDPSYASTTDENLTATDRLSRDLFVKYIESKQSAGPSGQTDLGGVVQSVLSQDYSATSTYTYTDKDILVLKSDSLFDLKTYGNRLGQALNAPIPAGMVQETIIVERVSNGESSDLLKSLSVNEKRYLKIRASLLSIPVPYNLKNAHVAIINGISRLADIVNAMIASDIDPVGSMSKMASYDDDVNLIDTALSSVRSYFSRKNIAFSSNEDGYIITQ